MPSLFYKAAFERRFPLPFLLLEEIGELIKALDQDPTAEQVEQIKLALELSEILGPKQEATAGLDAETLAAALRSAVAEVVQSMPKATGPSGSAVSDPARPKMGHNSMTSIAHKDSGLEVQGAENLSTETEGDEDAAEKLRRLKELKGTK